MPLSPTGSRYRRVNGGGVRVGTLTSASLTTALAGNNNDLTFTADNAGVAGNDISVRYVVAGNSTPLSVSVAGNAITVNVATDAGGLPTSTATQAKNAIDANTSAAALVNVANAPGNDGTGVVAAMAATNLSGGTSYSFGTLLRGLGGRRGRS